MTGVFCSKLMSFVSGPEIELKGLILPKTLSSKKWQRETMQALEQHLENWLEKHPLDKAEFSEHARIFLRKILFHTFKKKPVALVKFHFI